MIVVCTQCQEELADVTVLVPFSASVGCGKCGATTGHRFVVDDNPPAILSREEQIAQAELDLADLAAKLKELKATPKTPAAAAGS
jgi:ferredoxin